MIILPESGNISILASGGADSTILAYIIAKYYPDRKPRLFLLGSTVDTLARLKRITKRIAELTGYEYSIKHFKEKTHIRPTVDKILGVLGGCVITGCNKVVEGVFTPTVYIKDDTPPKRGPPLNDRHLRPFIDMDKIEVLRLYKDHGVVDLLHMTRSCGLEQGVCGGCYFCMERAWACSVLDIQDIQDK